MATLAIGTELPAMQISVALRALRGGGGENQRGMATLAGYTLVHTEQRESGLSIVVEFRRTPDGLPCGSGVAVLAASF